MVKRMVAAVPVLVLIKRNLTKPLFISADSVTPVEEFSVKSSSKNTVEVDVHLNVPLLSADPLTMV